MITCWRVDAATWRPMPASWPVVNGFALPLGLEAVTHQGCSSADRALTSSSMCRER